jgi:hypothetical protein
MTCIDCGSAAGSCTCQNWDEIDRLGKETKACHCVHCTPGGERCPRCHPESRDATVCVRLDGLADKIAELIYTDANNHRVDATRDDCAYFAAGTVALLQSLAVQ